MKNAVLLSFSGIVSAVYEIIRDHLLKNGLLLIRRQKEHGMDNLKCWLPKELANFALECGMMTFKNKF